MSYSVRADAFCDSAVHAPIRRQVPHVMIGRVMYHAVLAGALACAVRGEYLSCACDPPYVAWILDLLDDRSVWAE